jgi:uncharacterized protein
MSLKDLHQKIHDFEQSISSDALRLSQCKAGCSGCCYVDLSVFEIEAQFIRDWFQALPTTDRATLETCWSTPTEPTQEAKPCAFLYREQCTIYEARPVICRSQGLALKFDYQGAEALDICPLNEEMIDLLDEHEILNLDTLNTILARLEMNEAGGAPRERMALKDLRAELMSYSTK